MNLTQIKPNDKDKPEQDTAGQDPQPQPTEEKESLEKFIERMNAELFAS